MPFRGVQVLHVKTEATTLTRGVVLTPPLFLETLFLFPYEGIQNDLNPFVEHNWDKQL